MAGGGGAAGPRRGSGSPATSGRWQLAGGLRLVGLVSAGLQVLGALALMWLVATDLDRVVAIPLVDPSVRYNYYGVAWVTAVLAGAQIVALLTGPVSRIWWATLLRAGWGVALVVISPRLRWELNLSPVPLIHLAVSVAILAVIADAWHQGRLG